MPESSMRHSYADCVHFVKQKVRSSRNAKIGCGCENGRMSRKRKTDKDFNDLDVESVPADVAIPRHFLKEWREHKGLSQDDLAALIDTSKSTISGFENSRELSQSWLWRIATALRIPPGYILQYDPKSIDMDILELWVAVPEDERAVVKRQIEALGATNPRKIRTS